MGASGGTNNRAKLLALWGLLTFVKHHGIHLHRIMGYSKVIVDWVLNHQSLQSIALHHWNKRVWLLLDEIQTLSFLHVYREFNNQEDLLSKQAVGLDLGLIYWKEFSHDSLIMEGVLSCH